MRILSSIFAEGFDCQIVEEDDRSVVFVADMDVDADGADGQHGARAAYMVGDHGSEALANGGMGMRNGKVVGVTSWFSDIVLLDSQGHPLVIDGGIIPSRTSYRLPGFKLSDPQAYIDAETIPYIVVPPIIIQATAGVVMGCRCVVTNLHTKVSVEGLVADAGPRNRIGEGSIEMNRRLGFNPNPRNGGEEKAIVRYQLFPGTPAVVNGVTYRLQRSNGLYI